MTEVPDTSIDYEDLVGYKAKETVPTDLSLFLGEQQEHKPQIKPRPVDPNFPEDWQNLFVNFRSEKDYMEFMKLIDEVPGPKTNVVIFSQEKSDGILNFL